MAVLEVLTRDTLALNPGGARIMALVNSPPLSLIETGIKQQPHGPACYTFPLFFPLFFFFFLCYFCDVKLNVYVDPFPLQQFSSHTKNSSSF